MGQMSYEVQSELEHLQKLIEELRANIYGMSEDEVRSALEKIGDTMTELFNVGDPAVDGKVWKVYERLRDVFPAAISISGRCDDFAEIFVDTLHRRAYLFEITSDKLCFVFPIASGKMPRDAADDIAHYLAYHGAEWVIRRRE